MRSLWELRCVPPGAYGQTRPGVGPFCLLQAGGGHDPGGADGGRRRYAPLHSRDRCQQQRPEERRVAFIDDYGGKVELSTQQLRT